MCFLQAQARMWNNLTYTVFGTRTLDEFNRWLPSTVGAVNNWLLPWVGFFQFSAMQVLVVLRKKFINNLVHPTCACAAGFIIIIIIIIIILIILIIIILKWPRQEKLNRFFMSSLECSTDQSPHVPLYFITFIDEGAYGAVSPSTFN